MSKIIYPPAYIEWVDSSHISGWNKIGSIDLGKSNIICRSIGWIVEEDEDVIIISGHLDSLKDDNVVLCNTLMSIPKCSIINQWELEIK